MNQFLASPMPLQLVLLFVLGLLVGGQLNRGIYRLAMTQRRLISPWSNCSPGVPPRRWYDRIPVTGWFGLRRETAVHGAGFWVRPMLLELMTGVGFAAIYKWEMDGGLIPAGFPLPAQSLLLQGILSRLVLFSLMIVATFIDFDEKTIPDEITVYGAMVGCVLAALMPDSLLSDPIAPGLIHFLTLTAPISWPAWLDGPWGLVVGLFCFAGWFYAILPKIWWTRGGIGKAVRYLLGSILRYWNWWVLVPLATAGSAGIATVCWIGGAHWQALLSSLVGMAFGGGLIWAVRIVGSVALGREAMGFGDVTLMAMIGAFIGWQPSVIVFFLAPLAGLMLAVTQWVLTGRKEIPYGPFLCLATVFLVAGWTSTWFGFGRPIFFLGKFIPFLLAGCLLLMLVMLTVWRRVTEWVFH